MGTLVGEDGRAVTLHARTLVGRSRSCALRMSHPSVSGEHASVWWADGRWWVRDLASRNGTRVGGALLPSGESRALAAGDVLAFGEIGPWVLQEAEAPVARAVPVSGGRAQVAAAGLLALPAEEEPELTLYPRGDGSWMASSEDGDRVVHDLDVVVVAEQAWRLHLPQTLERTSTEQALRVVAMAVTFHVSQDEETVGLVLTPAEGRPVLVEPRAHHYVLLLLARARLEEVEQSPAERGWVDRELLCRWLATDRKYLNVLLHRARRHLQAAGVQDAGRLIERRHASLRIGLADIRIRSLEDWPG